MGAGPLAMPAAFFVGVERPVRCRPGPGGGDSHQCLWTSGANLA